MNACHKDLICRGAMAEALMTHSIYVVGPVRPSVRTSVRPSVRIRPTRVYNLRDSDPPTPGLHPRATGSLRFLRGLSFAATNIVSFDDESLERRSASGPSPSARMSMRPDDRLFLFFQFSID